MCGFTHISSKNVSVFWINIPKTCSPEDKYANIALPCQKDDKMCIHDF